jgi:zinc protease
LLEPTYASDEIEKVKAEQLGAIAEANNDTRATADRLLWRAVYPAPNSLGRRILGSDEIVRAFDAGMARRYHDRAYRPQGSSIAVVGGIEGFDRAVGILEDAFDSWPAATRAHDAVDTSASNHGVVSTSEEIPGKSQADLALGIATIPRNHPDYYALDVANLILGRLGLMGRLGAEVRDRQGLAYYTFSQLEPRNDGSLWSARAGVDPANVERTVEAMERELERLREELVSDEEIRDAKSYLIGVLPLALESHDGVASLLLAIEEFGLGLDYLSRYPDLIAAVTREDVRAAANRHLDPALRVISSASPV